jgi:hypothetical protein
MSMTTSSKNGFIQPPTLADIREGLKRMITEDFDSVWDEICRTAGVSPSAGSLDEAGTDRLLNAVGNYDRMCTVMAMSWRIRLTAARKLAEIGR